MNAHPYLVAHLASEAMFLFLVLSPPATKVEKKKRKVSPPVAAHSPDPGAMTQVRMALEHILKNEAHPIEARQEAVELILTMLYETAYKLGKTS